MGGGYGTVLKKTCYSGSNPIADVCANCYNLSMRLKYPIYILIAALFWPWSDRPSNYVRWEDKAKTSLPIALVFGFPCVETLDSGAISIDTSPKCRNFEKEKEYRGVWLYEFEGSTFIENAVVAPVTRPPYGNVAWLEYNPIKIYPETDPFAYDDQGGCYKISAFRVRFVGRERRGRSGHLGLWGREIWASQAIEEEPIPGPACEVYNR